MNKIGIYPTYWEQNWIVDVEEYIRKAARLGFDVLEINIANVVDVPNDRLREIRKTADEQGVELTYSFGLGLEHDLANPSDSVRKGGERYLHQVLDTVHLLGGGLVAGITYSAWHASLAQGEDNKKAARERSIQSVRRVAKHAEDVGITYCVEAVNRFEAYLINTAEEAVQYVEEVESPAVKILLDTFHMNIEEDSFHGAILTAGKHLVHLHVGESNRKPPGEGRIPWDEIAQALHEIDYRGRIVMEPFVRQGGAVGRDISVWRDLVNPGDLSRLDADAKIALEFMREKMTV